MTTDKIIEFPVENHENSKNYAKEILHKFKPSLSISIERASLMSDGTYRNWKNQDIFDWIISNKEFINGNFRCSIM